MVSHENEYLVLFHDSTELTCETCETPDTSDGGRQKKSLWCLPYWSEGNCTSTSYNRFRCRGSRYFDGCLQVWFFRSTPPCRPNKVGLKYPSVRSSVHRKFLRFQWNFLRRWRSTSDAWWYARYDPIQGQVQGHEPWKSEIQPFSKAIFSPFIMGTGKWPRILQFGGDT